MKIGIIGLPQAGKKTLFKALTDYTLSEKDKISNKPVKSLAEIKDARFDKLAEVYKPQKLVRARIDIELLPKIAEDAELNARIFENAADLDAVCYVVRTFKDDTVYHVKGSVEPKRDIDFINSELVLNDLLFIEKRFERINKSLKVKQEKILAEEKELLGKLKEQLDKELPLRLLPLEENERRIISSYPFITQKKMIVVLNVSEDDINNTALRDGLKQEYKGLDVDIMQVSAQIEAEIAGLETENEKKEFLEAVGIKEPAINLLTGLCIRALNLVSFFTVGSDEVRQWTIKTGSSAPEAAGAIHSDMERGFIRAEVMKFDDLMESGDEKKVKAAGKFYLKGKDYIVEDGDIIGIRFNV